MLMRGLRRGGAVPSVLSIMLLAVIGAACNLSTGDSAPSTQTAAAHAQHLATLEAFSLGLTQTALAALQATRSAPTPTSPAPGAHSPAILQVDFPATIPADGTTVHGSIRFIDAGADVNLVTITTLEGNFASGSWDPAASIAWSGTTGIAPFDSRCTGPQTVRARVILKDAAGSTSVHADFGFICR